MWMPWWPKWVIRLHWWNYFQLWLYWLACEDEQISWINVAKIIQSWSMAESSCRIHLQHKIITCLWEKKPKLMMLGILTQNAICVLIASRWKYLGLRIQGYCYQMFLGFQSHTHWQHWWGVAELGKQHYLMFLLVGKPLDVLLEISSSMATLKYKKHLHGYLGK